MLGVLSLFAGIGGFDLGLERTGGFKTVAFCEIDPFARRVLAKHWPGVPCYDDVRTLSADRLAADGISVDVICGGFPCQDISLAGRGEGLAGERSGLWREYSRLAGEIRPQFVIVENVAALLGRGLGDVLGDMAAIGYDAEWHCIPASSVGAPHRRDRVWIVAYPSRQLPHGGGAISEQAGRAGPANCGDVGYAQGVGRGAGRQRRSSGASERSAIAQRTIQGSNTDIERLAIGKGERRNDGTKLTSVVGSDWWIAESAVDRVVDGLPGRVDRLRCLGNAVVPQIPELIGRSILASLA